MLTGIAFVGVVPQESRVVERAADKLYLLASVIPPSLCHTWTAILAVLSHKIFVWWYDALCAPERAIETKCLLGEIFSYCHITMQLYRPSPCARGYPEPHWCCHKCNCSALSSTQGQTSTFATPDLSSISELCSGCHEVYVVPYNKGNLQYSHTCWSVLWIPDSIHVLLNQKLFKLGLPNRIILLREGTLPFDLLVRKPLVDSRG